MNQSEITRPTVMEVNVQNFKHNIQEIKKKLNSTTTIMPIMKANAYGTYFNTKLEIVNEFEIIGVATVDEGINLRKIGFNKEIFVLNQPARSEINKIVENDLVIGLSSKEFLQEIEKQKQPIRVHLEIETGMGRTGITLEEISPFLKEIKQIKIEGIYTHLSSPDKDCSYTEKQLTIFQEAVEMITKQVKDIKYIHVLASNGIINFPKAQFNLVRPGMLIYGYESAEGIKEKIDLKPVAKLKSQITFIKTVEKGTSISYGRSFVTTKESKIATIPIGYADGIRRSMSNHSYVVVGDKKAPIVGKICMDSFMVDVTNIKDAQVGTEVWIWDNDKITLEEVAHQCDTITYEILSGISYRVPRILIS